MGYIIYNGRFYASDAAVFKASNRAFKYGDALFETIRCCQQQPVSFQDHYQRLSNGMAMMQMMQLGFPSRQQFSELIAKLITKNQLFGDARVRLTVFREDGGLYTPESNRVHYLIEASPLSTQGYELNKKGLLLGVFSDELKSKSKLSAYKTGNAILFVLAGLYKQKKGYTDVLIKNSDGLLIEGLASNLFWIKNRVVYTPYRSSGCVDGIMRKNVMAILQQNGYVVEELPGASLEDLYGADELFLTNAIQGVQWVVGLNDKRYYCLLTKEIAQLVHHALLVE